MLLRPGLDNPGCLLERGAHRSAPFRIWIEPDWKFHGLVHQKQETTRVLTTDFGLVCHGVPPLFLASRELRLSYTRGHRLESCRDDPQNAATSGVRRVTLVTGERGRWNRNGYRLS